MAKFECEELEPELSDEYLDDPAGHADLCSCGPCQKWWADRNQEPYKC
jgi:hypothetical protein